MPSWAISSLSDGATVHRIYIAARPNDCRHGSEPMLYNGKVIGKSDAPLYDAARWLLSNNAASEIDTVAIYRGGTLSMHGIVGELSKWTVREDKRGDPSLKLVRWSPFHEADRLRLKARQAVSVTSRTALFDVPGYGGPCGSARRSWPRPRGIIGMFL